MSADAWGPIGLAIAPDSGHFTGSTASCLHALRSAWLQDSYSMNFHDLQAVGLGKTYDHTGWQHCILTVPCNC